MARTLVTKLGIVALASGATMLAACVDDEQPQPELGNVQLDVTDQLVRTSMTLRGIRPAVAELDEVAADPSALDGLVDGYLDTPEFGQVMRDLHNEALLLRTDYFFFPAGFEAKGALADVDPHYLNVSIQEAPLKLIEHVIMNDRPYTEVVTADYTLANAITAVVWGMVDYDFAGPEWQVTAWQDGRAGAGVLSDPWMYQRHSSTTSNANRGRANAISKALLCYDFLSRDIEVDASINLADPDVVKSAVTKNPACTSCHQTLDPLAGFFGNNFPLFVPNNIEYPFTQAYTPGLYDYAGIDLREPGFFGKKGTTLADLGGLMAEDASFSLCAASHFYSYFHQVALDDVPQSKAAEFQAVLINSGFNAKELAKAIVLDDDFTVSHSTAPSADDIVGLKKTRPDQLASMMRDLTGFVWETDLSDLGDVDLGRVELTRDSFLGFQVLGGGIDSQFVTRPAHTYSATSSLVLRTFAAEAAAHVVAADFATNERAARLLLNQIDEGIVDVAVVSKQLAWLHKRLYGEMVDAQSDEVAETYALFKGVFDHTGDARRAWEATLTAMLQDVKIAYY